MEAFEARRRRLRDELRTTGGKASLDKRTISNLFRYSERSCARAPGISLADFHHVLDLDAPGGTLDVEGLATYETIVDATLPHGLLPTVTPELKHITIGGAVVGIGIESTCFRHGFVHDGLMEAEVLLPDGRIVTCTPDNDDSDLFRALPNSYGTLGYILRARVRLTPAKSHVHLTSARFESCGGFLEAMKVATEDPAIDFIEGLFMAADRFYLLTARFADRVPHLDDIVRDSIYYRLIQQRSDVYLSTRDYIFRYDPEWFWNIPDGPLYRWFRRYAPLRFRNSGFYTRYAHWKRTRLDRLPWRQHDQTEPLIQDWQVPWDKAGELIEFALRHVDLAGRPWAAVPIRTPASPTLYPIRPDTLYFNLGSYTHVPRAAGQDQYHYTRIMDRKCFDLGGIKMLYSSSFLARDEFDRLYNGRAYADLKTRYDPARSARDLYDKAVGAA